MANEFDPEFTLVVRKRFTDDKWYWQYKDPGVIGVDEKNDQGPYETRVKAIKAAYRFEKPKKKVSDEEAMGCLFLVGIFFISLGAISLWGWAATFMACGFTCFALIGLGVWHKKKKAKEG